VLDLHLLFEIFLINTYGQYTSHYFSVFCPLLFLIFHLINSYCACPSCAFRDFFNKYIWGMYLALFFLSFCLLPSLIFHLITSYCTCLSRAFRDIFNKHIWVIYLALFFRLFVLPSLIFSLNKFILCLAFVCFSRYF
jgi:hypothetical protein